MNPADDEDEAATAAANAETPPGSDNGRGQVPQSPPAPPPPPPVWVTSQSTLRNATRSVPVGTIVATIALVLLAAAAIELVIAIQQLIVLVVISAFFATILNPAVDALVRRRIRRGLATGVVFFLGFVVTVGLGYLFLHPVYTSAQKLSRDLPNIIKQTEQGRGTIGKLLTRYHLDKWARKRIPAAQKALSHLGGPALSVARRVLSGVVGFVTVLVVTFLMLLEAPDMSRSFLALLPEARARRVQRIAKDVARSVTGYVLGNFATSIIAGVVVFVTLFLLHVPFAGVFGVWVGLVDLLPLVGGLLAGVPTVAIAALHSPKAGIVTLIVFLVYQQVENHILNPVIMSRTVRLNPLWVILSVLIGAQLSGIAGALLAIPAAGAIQVIVRDVWNERQARLATSADVTPPTSPPTPPAGGDGGDPPG